MSAKAKPTLISCIMPTHNRRPFVARAIEYFLRQDYEHRELIVVDDGSDAVDDLMPCDPRIRYIRLPHRATVGAKRNLACEYASGAIIAHWDDDDWHAPHRLSYQAAELMREEADVCGINSLLFYDTARECAWQYLYPIGYQPWLSGSSLCYRRDFWARNRFTDINVGEDACFLWTSTPKRLTVLPDNTFHISLIHGDNVSPKETDGDCWRPFCVETVKRLLGTDWPFYRPAREEQQVEQQEEQGHALSHPIASASNVLRGEVKTSVRNVYACLVHENEECIVDLVRNLRYHDSESVILLYNGGRNRDLLNQGLPLSQYGAVVHPSPRPMSWGYLHGFALDCMQFALDNLGFDVLTMVDSDQMQVRPGYTSFLGQYFSNLKGVGMLGNSPERQPAQTGIAPAIQAWKEFELWRPFLERFDEGEEKFVHWSFWPSTIFTADAARDLTRLFATDAQLQNIMNRSRIWATEEIVLPTVVSLLGYEVAANPCSYDYVTYKTPYSLHHLDAAINRQDVFWMHPVPRCYDNGLRTHMRARFNHYERAASPGGVLPMTETNSESSLLLTLPILAQMRRVEGWLDDEEADLLIAATVRALASLPGPHAIVEVGSYCGRSTVVMGSVLKALDAEARLYAIDPHDGKVGALDQGLTVGPSTLTRFKRTISDANLTETVEMIQKCSFEVAWDKPISLLLIDGLHDYPNVARDFLHFQDSVLEGGYIAFHDYADYYPGVQTFVNEILATGRYRKVHCEKSMMVVQKLPIHNQ